MRKLLLIAFIINLVCSVCYAEYGKNNTNTNKLAYNERFINIVPKKGVKSHELKGKLEKQHPNLKFKNLEYINVLIADTESLDKENKSKASKKIHEDEDVKNSTIDHELRVLDIPNDALFTNQWAANKISLLQGWNITKGNPNIIVAVIDTGIDFNHPDLAPNLFYYGADNCYGYQAINGVLKPGGMDDYGHGTHVAGIIAAKDNNNIGVVGVAPNVKLMSFKFIGANGNGWSSDALIIINKIIELKVVYGLNIKVSNNSWGGGAGDGALETAFQVMEDNGIISVVAAGNSNTDSTYNDDVPATFDVDSIISVAATDSNDQKAAFSSYGFRTDISAPGVGILNTVMTSTNVEIYDLSGYAALSGTSMACPHVAGLCALVLSLNPNLTPVQVKNIILNKNNTDWLNDIFTVTGARINVVKTLANSLVNIPLNHSPVLLNKVTNYSILAGKNLTHSFNATDSDNDILYYFIYSSLFTKRLDTNYISSPVPWYVKDRSYYLDSIVIDRNGGVDFSKTYVDVFFNKDIVTNNFDLNVNVYKHPWSKSWYVADVCYNNTGNLYWIFDAITWTIDGSPYVSRSSLTNINCNSIGYSLNYEPEHMVEVKALNEIGQWYNSPRFYFNGSETVYNPTNRFPHLVINTDVDSGAIPLTVHWNISSSYDEDGTIQDFWHQEYFEGVGWVLTTTGNLKSGARVFDVPGNYFMEFMVRDNNGGVHWDYKEVSALYSANTPSTNPPPCNSPVLVNQSVSQTNMVGSSLTIFANFNGTAPLSYQWYLNDNILNGQINNTLTINNTQAGVNKYYVKANNACGVAQSGNIYVSVTNVAPPLVQLVAPQDLSVSSDNGRITLHWTDSSVNEDRWEIEYTSKSKGAWPTFRTLTTLQPNSNIYSFVAQRNINYQFRVKVCNGVTCSQYSNIVSIRAK